MTRPANDPTQFSALSLWIRPNCQPSKHGLCVTNLDFVVEHFKRKKLMLVEEKRYGGSLAEGQEKTFALLDQIIKQGVSKTGYQYWGFYLIQFSGEGPEDSEEIRINGKLADQMDLRQHMDFAKRFCEPMKLEQYYKGNTDAA